MTIIVGGIEIVIDSYDKEQLEKVLSELESNKANVSEQIQWYETTIKTMESKKSRDYCEERNLQLLKEILNNFYTSRSNIETSIQNVRKKIQLCRVNSSSNNEEFNTTFRQVDGKPTQIASQETKYSYVDICKDIFGAPNDAHRKKQIIKAIKKYISDVYTDYTCSFKGNGNLKFLYVKNDKTGSIYNGIILGLRKKFRIYWKSKNKMYDLVCKKIQISKNVFDDLIQNEKFEQMSFVIKGKQDSVYIHKNCVDDLIELYLAKREEYIKKEIESRNVKHRGRKKKIDPYLVKGPVIEDNDYIPNTHFLYAGDAVARALDVQNVEPVTEKDYSSSENKMRELTKIIHTLIVRCQD